MAAGQAPERDGHGVGAPPQQSGQQQGGQAVAERLAARVR